MTEYENHKQLKALGIDVWLPKAELLARKNKQIEATKCHSRLKPVLLILASAQEEHCENIKQLLENILCFLQIKLVDCDILYSPGELPQADPLFHEVPKTVIGFGNGTLSMCPMHAESQAVETLELGKVLTKPTLKKRLLMDIYGLKDTIVK